MIRRLIIAGLLCASVSAQAQLVDDGMSSISIVKKTASGPSLLFTEDANTVSHVYFDGAKLVDTKGLPWVMNGTVPQVPKSGGVPAGAGPFSDVNYYSLAAPSALNFNAAPFTMLMATIPTTQSNEYLPFGNYSSATGWTFDIVASATTSDFLAPASINAPGTMVDGSVNYLCGGADATTVYSLLNAGGMGTAASSYVKSTAPTYIGRYDGATGFSFAGTILEILVTTTTPSSGYCSTLIAAARAKTG